MDAVLIDDYHKSSNSGQNFVHRTIGKLLNKDSVPFLHKLHLHNAEIVLEMSKFAKVLQLSNQAYLPTHQRGLFILVKGELKVETLWNTELGMSQDQI